MTVAALTREELLRRGAFGALAIALAGAPEARAVDPRLRSLERAVRGPVARPGSRLYEAARPYNSRYAGVRPLAVVRPLSAADVRQAVLWSARTGVPLAARSGGHSYAGYSTTRGVVVDLSSLAGVRLGGDGRATIGAGERLWDVYTALARRGRAISAGSCPTVGIAGLALGGGFGLASRAWGLTCDDVVEVQVVTADGRVLTCDRRRHPDLFWACRGGGGGNFGIVTRFVFRTHRAASGSWYAATWPWSALEPVVRRFQDWAPDAPDRVSAICRLATSPSGPTLQVFGQYLGPEPGLRDVLRPLVRGPAPSRLSTGAASWLDLQRRWAGCLGEPDPECRAFRAEGFAAASAYAVRPLSAKGIDTLRRLLEARGAAGGAALMDAYGGAVRRVAADATAFAHRDALFSLQYLAYGSGGGEWVRRLRDAMRPHVSRFAYQNYIDPTLADWRRAYYGANLPRLAAVKKRYDPDRVFRFRQAV